MFNMISSDLKPRNRFVSTTANGAINPSLFTFLQNINPAEVSLRVFGNGTIFYTMRRHLILNCEGDLPIFPFDSPMCDFNVESSEY